MALALMLFFCAMASLTVGIFLSKHWWLPTLASANGAAVDHQLVLTLCIAGTIFFLAQICLGIFIFKFRGKGQRASYWHENSRLEIGWTLATAVLFIGLGLRGDYVWANYFQGSDPDEVMIEVTAQQFAWNIRYPGPDNQFGRTSVDLIDDSMGEFLGIDYNDPASKDDIVTQNLMAVPVNHPIRVYLKTKDVTHSFFLPNFRVKQDTLPGLMTNVHFTPTTIGEYEIACAELCGMQHYMMRGRLLVLSDEDYQAWLAARAF